MESLINMFKEPTITKCEGPEGHPLPRDVFPEGVDMTEYRVGETLVDAVCRFKQRDGLCGAPQMYFGVDKFAEMVCKYVKLLETKDGDD